ncbi:hypothetical protein BJV77DRAFT_971841 [Russula vinacea]|nr:hypothetical protein BJV77DRAFT_971841 [Russula vinacea]
MPNSLSLALTESVLFLRGVHISHQRPTSHENASPSILRGLLILVLSKPTRISSIQVELVAQSVTIWTESQSTRYPAELQEKNKLFSATRTFFQAPCSTTGRRALSLDPGLSYYADQDEFTDRPRRSSSSPTRDRPSPTPRGRERGRGRIGADEHNSQHDPQEDLLRSLPALDSSLVSEIVPPLNSPPHHHADERHVSYDDNLFERPRSRSRGRMSARFSFATMSNSILQAVLGVSSKESRGDDHSQPPGLLRHLGEPVSLDSNEQTSDDIGNGWQEFKKGRYTFPISFVVPSQMPPTMQCDYGSVVWRLKATVHRPGPFTPKLSASREVNFVASPSEDDREDVDNVTIERTWEDQMQYMLTVSGRVFPIGGSVPITLTILPMAKVKIFGLSVILEERVDYFFSFSPTACRKDPKRRFELLSLKSDDENHPLLHSRRRDAASEFMANLMGPGPWTLQMCLTVPNACGMLHFSNKNRRAPIEVSHLLKVVLRAQRGDELVDPQSGKPKQFDIVIRMPVHVLSPLSNVQHTALPRYSEIPDAPAPCASFEDDGHFQFRPHRSSAPGCQTVAPLASSEEQTPPEAEVDRFYERNVIFERLITGQQREDGVVPPAYCTA